jgi:hypothetical protein
MKKKNALATEVRAMMKAMTKPFTKNQQPTDMCLEWMEHSIARIIDRVEVLETGALAVDQDKLPDDTCEDDHDEEDEMEEVDDEEPFNPPPRQQHRDDQRVHQELPHPPRRPNWQGMGGHPHRGPNKQRTHDSDDPFAKVKFMIPPFYGLCDVEAY